MVKEGDTLTISGEIITIGGQIIFTEGQKVIVDEVIIEKGHYSRLCPDIWYDDKVLWVKIEGEYGLWRPEAFVEDLNATILL
jgi:hypothetical protein